MSKFTYLLIGGNGFIGTNLIYKLLDNKREVYCIDAFDSNTKSIQNKHFKSYIDDLTDVNLLKQLVKKSDIIIFLASSSHVRNSSEAILIEIDNIECFINTLDIIKQYPDKKLIYASSGGTVYGEPEAIPVSENHCLNPISPYGIGKITMEQFLKYYASKYGINYVICRYSNPYGKYQSPFSGVGVINKLLYDYNNNTETNIVGNPDESIRDYIYISDLVDATIAVAEADSCKNEIFNVGSGEGTSLNQIINEIKAVLNDDLKLNSEKFGNENVSKIVLDITKIKKIAGWKPKISLKKGIKLNNEYIKEFLEKNK
ncbi:MAG: GDP-mannose 4,6-dehydratase [Methanobacteriaceae archaeon]|nr:GDP-mannose 4,6-dehydratase [Methanobacteriaceae archaeon]